MNLLLVAKSSYCTAPSHQVFSLFLAIRLDARNCREPRYMMLCGGNGNDCANNAPQVSLPLARLVTSPG